MERTVEHGDWLAERFEGHRAHLRAVADIANLGGWLTTVVGRVCLDMLRSRTSRREEPLPADGLEPTERLAFVLPSPAKRERGRG